PFSGSRSGQPTAGYCANLLVSRSFSRQWFVNARAGRPVSQLPGGRVYRARDLLHVLVVDLFDRIRRAVVILMHSVHVKDDRDSLPRVVVMVAAIKELLGVFRVVILVVECKVQVRLVDRFAQVAQLRAHHFRSDKVDLARLWQRLVCRFVVLTPGATDHVNVEFGDDLADGNRRAFGEIAGAPQPFLFACVPDKKDGAFRPRASRKSLRQGERRDRPRPVVVSAVVYRVAVDRRSDADVVVMRADGDVFIFQNRIAPFENRDHVLRGGRRGFERDREAHFLVGLELKRLDRVVRGGAVENLPRVMLFALKQSVEQLRRRRNRRKCDVVLRLEFVNGSEPELDEILADAITGGESRKNG